MTHAQQSFHIWSSPQIERVLNTLQSSFDGAWRHATWREQGKELAKLRVVFDEVASYVDDDDLTLEMLVQSLLQLAVRRRRLTRPCCLDRS